MDLLSNLNEPQRQAVQHVDGPLLVLAGAGSGKTRVITRRIAWLIRQGIAPWNVLALTFTNKAAQEMARRVEQLGTPRGATVSTFHSLCARLLRELAPEAGLQSSFSIYDTADQTKLVKMAMDRGDVGTGLTPGKALSAISRAKMQLLTPTTFAEQANDFVTRKLAKLYEAYERALRAANALDFDDLLMRMAFLMRDRPDVRQALAERYRYVLIDEYQDTNHAQYIIAHGIALAHENICATGDPDQSIYAWRGADIQNILDFEKDYPNAVVVRLEENYRSTTPILSAASALIAHNRNRKPKELFTRRPGGEPVTIVTAPDEHAEANDVVHRIRELAAGGEIGYGDVAVFYRLNSLSRVMEDALRKSGIPYRIARGTEFYNRKEIRDVLAYLKLVVNPADEVACERIINVPTRGIGATTVKRLQDFAMRRDLALLAAARQADAADSLGRAASRKVTEFAEMIDAFSALPRSPVRDIVEAVITRTGLEAELRAQGSDQASELANVMELVTTAAEFDSENPGATLEDYLSQVALVSDIDRFEGGQGAVTLMTLHAAKGLEFPAVFLIGCEEGLLPFEHPTENRRDLEEERRLCFVGVTRAMRHMTLSCARYRSIRGQRHRQAASGFLTELGYEQVRRVDLVEENPGEASARLDETIRQLNRADDDDFFDPDAQAPLVDEDVFDESAELEAEALGDASGGLRPGCRVRHDKFATGRVASMSRSGPYTRVVVDFDRFGRKTLILQYARLELL